MTVRKWKYGRLHKTRRWSLQCDFRSHLLYSFSFRDIF